MTINKIMSLLGYMTEAEAKASGFTHHGSYYGIPLWVGDPWGECVVAVKWAPMELVMSLFHCIEEAMNLMLGNEPSFMFKIHGDIQ